LEVCLVNLARLLDPELILLEMETRDLPEEEREEIPREKYVLGQKEKILSEFVDLLERSGRTGNRNKLFVDLFNREKRAGTGLERGIAVPHVRTAQAKEFLFAFARSTPGLEFDCQDGEPAHLFFILVAPPYDDELYLKIYRKLASAFANSGFDLTREFLDAQDEGEIIRTLRHLD
jgi:mannitol/fructose-specific phosphotransferase system IIA component (Ntr-type)